MNKINECYEKKSKISLRDTESKWADKGVLYYMTTDYNKNQIETGSQFFNQS